MAAEFGPELSKVHAKLREGKLGFDWLYTWIREPERHHPRTKMPHLFLDGASTDLAVRAAHLRQGVPELTEAARRSAREALACGVPVITSHQCGAAELLMQAAAAGTPCGAVCDALDVPALAALMDRIAPETTATELASQFRYSAMSMGRAITELEAFELAQTEAAMEVFRAQGHGHLVMISSMSAAA